MSNINKVKLEMAGDYDVLLLDAREKNINNLIVSEADFMTNGPGRYVSAASFGITRDFGPELT